MRLVPKLCFEIKWCSHGEVLFLRGGKFSIRIVAEGFSLIFDKVPCCATNPSRWWNYDIVHHDWLVPIVGNEPEVRQHGRPETLFDGFCFMSKCIASFLVYWFKCVWNLSMVFLSIFEFRSIYQYPFIDRCTFFLYCHLHLHLHLHLCVFIYVHLFISLSICL